MKEYSREDVLSSAIKYFDGDELSATVWMNKYALKDSKGKLYERDPNDMHARLAKELVRIEQKYPNPMDESRIYDMLRYFKYAVPQGGPMAGIGNSLQTVSLSNCFVIGQPSDSYGSINMINEEQVQLMKRRGGVGHDLSHIRPAGTAVNNSALTSTGIVPFMERYSNTTREVAQDGRRGALMLSIDIKHPDTEAFIDVKQDRTKVTGANISVKISDEFMACVDSGKPFVQEFPIGAKKKDIITSVEINAKKLWDKIVYNAWKSAEPGVLFWDTFTRESISDCYEGFENKSTNPCAELPLPPYDSCRLLAMNLFSYVDNKWTKDARFDWNFFKKHVEESQRLMDDIVDLEIEKIEAIIEKIKNDPEPEEVKLVEFNLWHKILEKAVNGRRTGLGATGAGDMLASLGLRYGSKEATDFMELLHMKFALAAYGSSVTLAKERGAFPVYDRKREVKNPFIKRLFKQSVHLSARMKLYGRRNIAILTIAPTGTTSMMTKTSSGLEPAFMISYKRKKKVNAHDPNVRVDFVDGVGDAWTEYNVFHHAFILYAETLGHTEDELINMQDAELNKIIAKSPYHKATANDIDWLAKVEMQGRIQKWIDHSISVTVNIPNSASVELVDKIYRKGHEVGCKGLTVYRDGCRDGVLTSKDESKETDFEHTHSPKRPKTLPAKIVRFKNNYEHWIAITGFYKDKPYEIFVGQVEESLELPKDVESGFIVKERYEGKKQYRFKYVDSEGVRGSIDKLSQSLGDPQFRNYAKLISANMRHGMPLKYNAAVVSTLDLPDDVTSWKKGMVRALTKLIPNDETPLETTCEECGEQNSMKYSEGCLSCKECGWSKC